jgi:periplasmic mercuric ion binding protein
MGEIKYFYLQLKNMKSILIVSVAFFLCTVSANAQAKVSGKAIIKVPALTCEVCKDKIEQYLFRAYGVTSVKADFKKHTVTVTWLTDRTNIEQIKTHIANNGFDADNITAEEYAAKKLPPCCKNTGVVIAKKVEKIDTPKTVVVTNAPVVSSDTVKLNKVQAYLKKQQKK